MFHAVSHKTALRSIPVFRCDKALGCAGFTRGDREVLPDITKPKEDATVLSARIEVSGGDSTRTIEYRIGDRCRELSSFYAFDSTSVRVHLSESNRLSFSPAGLSCFTELAEVTDQVRLRLQGRIDECCQPHSFDRLFVGQSQVVDLVRGLGPTTDLDAVRRLASLSEDERNAISRLDIEIARLKSRDVPREIQICQQTIKDLETLAQKLKAAEAALSDDMGAGIHAAITATENQRRVAENVSLERFKSGSLTQVGNPAWYRFAGAARALADAEGLPEDPYPRPDSICLLCHQPLSPQARELLSRLWEFLEGEAQSQLKRHEEHLASVLTQVRSVFLDFFNEDTVAFRHLEQSDADLLQEVRVFLVAAEARRAAMLAIPSRSPQSHLPPLARNPSATVETLTARLSERLQQLQQEDPTSRIKRWEQDKVVLEHRATLGQHLSEIEEYVRRRGWAERAQKVRGDTGQITRFHNKLFSKLVTDRYIGLFQDLLRRMGRPLRVKVVTKGRKGEVLKQIAVETDPSADADIATPEKVLCEGEKRAVALADFLTEVAVDTTSSGIILDDPVTSLDLEWRQLIASMLSREAARRQVVVFTHDLPFLYFLKKEADEARVPTCTHWIKRGDVNDKPGYVFLDNSPALEKEYKKTTRSRDIYAKAKDAPAHEQESLLRQGFGALRTSYEAFIIFDLLAEVVLRFDERVSFGRLKDVRLDPAIVAEVIEGCERLSRFIEGHLHSDAMQAQKPTPQMLLSEIEAFDAMRKRHKESLRSP